MYSIRFIYQILHISCLVRNFISPLPCLCAREATSPSSCQLLLSGGKQLELMLNSQTSPEEPWPKYKLRKYELKSLPILGFVPLKGLDRYVLDYLSASGHPAGFSWAVRLYRHQHHISPNTSSATSTSSRYALTAVPFLAPAPEEETALPAAWAEAPPKAPAATAATTATRATTATTVTTATTASQQPTANS